MGAMATAGKRKESKPATPRRKRRANGPSTSTPPKRPRIVDQEQEAEKRRKNKELELRRQVLGATNPRERALALAQEAMAKGIIKPSWARQAPKSKPNKPADEVMNADAEASLDA